MNIVGIKELKNQLTQYLRRTKKGQEIIITERGKPIAVIRPTEGVLPATSLETKLTERAECAKAISPGSDTGRYAGSLSLNGQPI